jgi:hypothetical protein
MWGKKKFLDPELEDWHIECWSWLLGHFGGVEAVRAAPLVLPTGAFFPRVHGDAHEKALAVFERIKSLLGMSDWPCELVQRYRVNAPLGGVAMLQPEGKRMIAGTFESDGENVVISYDPDLVERPLNFIATITHELAHYLLHSVDEQPPGAEDEPIAEELATELAVACFGFGVIAANAAFEFEQSQNAWRIGSSGYFSEDGWIFALAVFLALRDETPDLVRQYLKPHLAKKLDQAWRRLADAPELIQRLRVVSSSVD